MANGDLNYVQKVNNGQLAPTIKRLNQIQTSLDSTIIVELAIEYATSLVLKTCILLSNHTLSFNL